MRKNYVLILIFSLTAIFTSMLIFCEKEAIAQAPPFSSITISGIAKRSYNKVGFFRDGSATVPMKTASVSTDTGRYNISINIPGDMIQYKGYYMIDMRFWKDDNSNGIKELSEQRSPCHFIIWYPQRKKVYLEVYNGPTHEITSSNFAYNP